MGPAPVRDADRTVMPPELVDQDGVRGHRQELSIVAVSTRVRLLSHVAPPDGRDLLSVVLGGFVELLHERCAGLDIGKKDVKVCVRTPSPNVT